MKIDSNSEYIFFRTNYGNLFGKTKVISMPNHSLTNALFDNFIINRLIKEEKIDIFHGPAHILPFRKIRGVKYVVTIHDLSLFYIPQLYSKIFNFYYKLAIRKSLNNADIIVTDSINTKNDVIRFFKIPENKIKVIYLGIDDVFFTAKKTKSLIYGKYFFSLTTHPKRKNTLAILEAMARTKKLSEYKLVIAGMIPQDQLKGLERKVKELKLTGKVIILGYVTESQLISLYQNAQFFIYPSYYEGFGLPVLEAMACRCPVITSNNSSLVEITPDKEWLVDPYSIEDISDKMVQLVNLSVNMRQKLIERNYLFSKKFTWEICTKKYLKLLDNLL